MGQDPNQPYNPYGQPPAGGVPPQQSGEYYQQGYQQPAPGYQQPAPGYQPPNTGYQAPNTGYQQPPYGQVPPYGQAQGQQQYNTASPLGATTVNMEPHVAAGVSYILGWITGLIFFLIEKQNRFVRFHAMQSILLSVVAFAIGIISSIINTALLFSSIGGLFSALFGLVDLALFVVWIICLVNAFQGKYFKLPLIGDYAERWSAPKPF